eukprot:GHVP01014828.1.p2 GENE.GHVP01014828.1~~GHVP01014828.1.p2  ORF type:complete len:166 (-),score=39.43 GHVP01014828.1:1189-1686(-)
MESPSATESSAPSVDFSATTSTSSSCSADHFDAKGEPHGGLARRIATQLDNEKKRNKALKVQLKKVNDNFIASASEYRREMLRMKKIVEEKDDLLASQKEKQAELIAANENLKRMCGIAADRIREFEEKEKIMQEEIRMIKISRDELQVMIDWKELEVNILSKTD